MRSLPSRVILLALIILALVVFLVRGGDEVQELAAGAMGTQFRFALVGERAERADGALLAALEEVRRIEGLMSPYREGSDIWRINRQAGGEAVRVAPEVIEVVELAQRVHGLTQGAFDITFVPVGRLWDFKRGVVPSQEQVRRALGLVGSEDLVVDRRAGTVRLAREGMAIDLGGVAKGYGAGRALDVMVRAGYGSGLVDAGGDLVVRGRKGRRPWVVGLRSPWGDGTLRGRFHVLRDMAIVTSGSYERFFVGPDGRRYSHIIDPRTGRPASGVASATVLHPDPALADAFATALMILEPSEGLALVRDMPGMEALIITGEGQKVFTPGVSQILEAHE